MVSMTETGVVCLLSTTGAAEIELARPMMATIADAENFIFEDGNDACIRGLIVEWPALLLRYWLM